jgi:hypothetical protein
MVVPVIVAAAAAMAVIGNSQNAVDGANGAADTGTDDTTDRAAHGAGDTVAFVRSLLGTTDNALGVAGLRQASQGQKDGSAGEKQTDE